MNSKLKHKMKTEAQEILKKAEYDVSEEINLYPKVFDYVAKKDDVRILLKTLLDINNIRKSLAQRLVEMSRLLLATPFLIGKKNKGTEMEQGVIYERHGIKSMAPKTLRDILIEGVPPLVYAAPGGRYANINSKKLREERKKNNLSRGELALRLGVSRSTIRKYEDGKDISVEKAVKLEEILDAPLFESLDLSYSEQNEFNKTKREINNPILLLLSSIGFDVSPTKKAPFKALSEAETNKFLTGIEEYNKRLKKKATVISNVSGVVDYKSFMVIKEKEKSNKSKIKDTPLLTEEEVERRDCLDEILTLIKERA
ncbi:hypothetical protein C9439_01285 [archaeon SCG-AAA382B04]|nr:hypothetical protein C9439_01285 [archaeon SCG-AAA382B04]